MTTRIESGEMAVSWHWCARGRLHTALVVMGIAVAGCAGAEDAGDEDVELGETSSSISVATAVNESCSTAIVRGLAKQIAEEVDCMAPDSLARFSATTRVRFSSNAVLPYMHPRAKADLLCVADDASLQVNSGYRTVVQQYLLYRWFRAGRCGIRAAALPGRSNHESGRAVDLANWSTRVGVMGSHHWAHDVPGDPVHFDHTLSPDNRGKDVRAFQRLWNRNHPGDLIAVDGVYGPQTAARVRRAPAKGFRKGPLCRAIEPGADVLAIDGPDRMAPESVAAYAITVANNDTIDWPASTRVVAAGGLPSVHYDPETWVSPTEVGTIGAAIAGNGGDGQFTIALRAPAVVEETTVETTLALVDGTRQIGTIDLAVIVTPNGDEETSGDAGETDEVDADSDVADEDGVVEAGCNAGGASGGSSVVLVALGLAVAGARRRRR